MDMCVMVLLGKYCFSWTGNCLELTADTLRKSYRPQMGRTRESNHNTLLDIFFLSGLSKRAARN